MLFGNCTFKPYRSFQKIAGKNDLPPQIYQLEVGEKLLFKTGLDFRDQHFSGLLLIKKMEQDTHRAVFTTELGLKMFDLEITSTDNQWHHCFDLLNRTIILQLIEADINLMFRGKQDDSETVWRENKTHRLSITKTKTGNELFLQQKQSGKVEKAHLLKGMKKEISTLEFSGEAIPENVSILHPRQKLYLQLHLLKN